VLSFVHCDSHSAVALLQRVQYLNTAHPRGCQRQDLAPVRPPEDCWLSTTRATRLALHPAAMLGRMQSGSASTSRRLHRPLPPDVRPCSARRSSVGARNQARWSPVHRPADGDRVRLFTRRGHDWTDRVPTIAEALSSLPVTSATIDGEAVVCDSAGVSDFDRLRGALDRPGSPDLLRSISWS